MRDRALLGRVHARVGLHQLQHRLSECDALHRADDVRVSDRQHVDTLVEVRLQRLLRLAVEMVRILLVRGVAVDQRRELRELVARRGEDALVDRAEELHRLLDQRERRAYRSLVVSLPDQYLGDGREPARVRHEHLEHLEQCWARLLERRREERLRQLFGRGV